MEKYYHEIRFPFTPAAQERIDTSGMSEYQYYEFLALDRPLDRAEMAELRALSTRAEITPARFINEYNWGNFKGSPEEMMERYFDAHVYVSNWGSYRLMLRMPRDCMDEDIIQPYVIDGCLGYWTTDTHLIIEWHCEDERDDGEADGEGWLSRLIPIRDELERGDYRALYLGWLFGAGMGEIPDEAVEPSPPPGLANLTPAQKALAEFLGIDPDLLDGAATAESPKKAKTDYAAWVAGVPAEEARQYLILMLEGQTRQAQRQLRSRYNKTAAPQNPAPHEQRLRSVAELLELAEQAQSERRKREEKERQRELEEHRRQREQYLAVVAKNAARYWKSAYASAEKKTASSYDSACSMLVDLAEVYAMQGRRDEFSSELHRFRARHARAAALLRRLDDAGLSAKE